MSMLKTVAIIAGVLVGVNAMSQTTNNPSPKETITLGGGCFWCTEAVFEQLKGVEKVESGYSGGQWRTRRMRTCRRARRGMPK